MKHGRWDSLIDRYVDGALEARLAVAVEAHAAGCALCAKRIESARAMAAALSGMRAPRAPRDFADRVMDVVYREALAGAPARVAADQAAGTLPAAGRAPAAAPGRVYRRLGLSFVLAAAVLAASLFIPSAAYPTLFHPPGAAAGQQEGGGAIVKGMLEGAGLTVRGTLHPQGRLTSGTSGG